MDYFSNDRVGGLKIKGWLHEKAIFILNKDVNPKQMPKDIVEEAENH